MILRGVVVSYMGGGIVELDTTFEMEKRNRAL